MHKRFNKWIKTVYNCLGKLSENSQKTIVWPPLNAIIKNAGMLNLLLIDVRLK